MLTDTLRLQRAVAAALVAAAFSPFTLLASDNHASGSGSWENPSLWSLGQAPSSSDGNDDLDAASGSALTITSTTTGSFPSTLQINNLNIGSSSGANSLTLDSTASSSVPLAVAGSVEVTQNGTLYINGGAVTAAAADFGTVSGGSGNQSAGSFTVSGDLHLGRQAGGNGQYTLQGGTLAVGLSEYVGQAFGTINSAGTFSQTGGTHTIANGLNVGNQSVGSGSYSMGGGLLAATNGIVVGDVGTFTQTGGTVNTINGNGFGNLNVTGVYTLHSTNTADPSVLNVASTEYVGTATANPALGTFLQDGGTQTITGNLTLARFAGNTASYTLSGGTLSATNLYLAGDTGAAGGTASFTISNGGTATLGSAQSGNPNGTIHVWPGGTLNVNAGGTLNTGTMINDGLINNGGGTLSYAGTITGAGTIKQTTGSSTIANGTTLDTGSLEIDGGTATGAGNLLIATDSNATGTLTLVGGTTTINGTLGVGNNGTLTGGSTSANGILNVNGGSLTAGVVILGNTMGSGGAMNVFRGGTVSLDGLSVNDATISGGSIAVGTQAAPAGTDPVIANAIVGGYLRNGALNVNGGTVTSPIIKMGLTSGYTGAYSQTAGNVTTPVLGIGNDGTLSGGAGIGLATITGGTLNADTVRVGSSAGGVGTLKIDSGASVNSTNGATISAGSMLTGNGVFNGGVINDGTIAPGDTLGTLTINGNVSFGSTSMLSVEIGGTSQGSNYDLLHGLEDVTLGGKLDISFANGFESAVTPSQTFTIVSADTSLSSFFTNVPSGSFLTTDDGQGEFKVTYNDGHDVVLSNFNSVPEPASLGLLWAGGLALLVRRRGSMR